MAEHFCRVRVRARHRGLAAALVLVLVVAGVAVALLLGWGDPRARKGYYEGKTPDEIREDLDSQVDWYAMEISVASSMQMEEGQTRVEARLENVPNNHCDQKVRMYVTGHPEDVLYQSGAIAPGEYVQYVDLAHSLPKGTHDVTVEFQGYDRMPTLVSDEGALLGHNRFGASAAAQVAINVVDGNMQEATQKQG